MNKSVRRSQLITSHGPGGLLDIGQESFIALDTSQWPADRCRTIRLARLETKVGASSGFKLPPTPFGSFDRNPPHVPFYRFPRWLFCPSCKRMDFWTAEKEKALEDGKAPACSSCGGNRPPALVPMRFLLICKSGHIGDIDWNRWAHSRHDVASQGQCDQRPRRLKFLSRAGGSSDLSSLSVRCEACGSSRSLKDLTNPSQLQAAGIFCSGRQPWQYFTGNPPRCKSEFRAEQRGASNVYYSQVWSALDISRTGQEDSGGKANLESAVQSHINFNVLKVIAEAEANPAESAAVRRVAEVIALDLNFDVDDVISVITEGGGTPEDADSPAALTDARNAIFAEEWPSLLVDNDEDNFITSVEPLQSEDKAQEALGKLIDRVVLVNKLREVRCLYGFTRVDPSGGDDGIVAPDLTRTRRWLPGIEVFGEGIFISFNEERVREWSEQPAVRERVSGLVSRYDESEGIAKVLPEPTPRLIMLHTFSHLLIRQLSFECGYSASSVRERIYSSEPGTAEGAMAGVMIYTADTDSEGSLGGLVRQGREDRFASSVLSALDRSLWCSGDPVCSEVEGQGLNGLNRAACHACSLVSETSCTMFNSLLDRALVTGDGDLGYFAPVTESFSATLS